MDFEEGGDHSKKPFFGCESLIGNNWGEGGGDATTDEVVPSYRDLLGTVGG